MENVAGLKRTSFGLVCTSFGTRSDSRPYTRRARGSCYRAEGRPSPYTNSLQIRTGITGGSGGIHFIPFRQLALFDRCSQLNIEI